MARERKISIAIVNIALTRLGGRKPTKENYRALMRAAFLTKNQILLRGERYAIMQRLDNKPTNNKLAGVIGTYIKIDVSDDWLNAQTGQKATPEDLKEINIPSYLSPHYRRFNFLLDTAKHKLAIEIRSEPNVGENKSELSPMLIEHYFNVLFRKDEVMEKFGNVGVTVLPQQELIETLINWKHASQIDIYIKPPNPDDDDLEEEIEKRMNEENIGRFEETLRSKPQTKLSPSSQTKALMRVAARNGFAAASGYENGQKRILTTRDRPFVYDGVYDRMQQDHISAFTMVAENALATLPSAKEE